MVFLLTDPQTYAIIVTKINQNFREKNHAKDIEKTDKNT